VVTAPRPFGTATSDVCCGVAMPAGRDTVAQCHELLCSASCDPACNFTRPAGRKTRPAASANRQRFPWGRNPSSLFARCAFASASVARSSTFS
jgi:hypothetical protein